MMISAAYPICLAHLLIYLFSTSLPMAMVDDKTDDIKTKPSKKGEPP
jgi:hypothetical protein